MHPDDPIEAATRERFDEVEQGERDVLLALLTYQPTTLAGIVAVLEHVSRQDWVYGDDSDQTILVDAHEREIEETKAFPQHLATALRNIIERRQS
jgi:hypothetical protein